MALEELRVLNLYPKKTSRLKFSLLLDSESSGADTSSEENWPSCSSAMREASGDPRQRQVQPQPPEIMSSSVSPTALLP